MKITVTLSIMAFPTRLFLYVKEVIDIFQVVIMQHYDLVANNLTPPREEP